jgi:hypothetical protein
MHFKIEEQVRNFTMFRRSNALVDVKEEEIKK